ncbi:MAG: metallophosphoesterase [Gammaproteobacteria bacterium]
MDESIASAVQSHVLGRSHESSSDFSLALSIDPALYEQLLRRIGRLHLKQRLGIELDHESQVFGQGIKFFHLENWYSIHAVIRTSLRLVGLYGRGRRNAADIRIRRNDIILPSLPKAFDGYRILQISDPHVDMDARISHALIDRVRAVDYDLCVLTGDYRARTFGPIEATLEGMQQLRLHLKAPVYGVLGNHDTVRMVPELEAMGIRLLLNEAVAIERRGSVFYLAGIDDAHYYQVDNLEKAAAGIPHEAVAVLLSHTPEIYRHAAHGDFDVMLCGHTHGGQICLPGGFPLTWDASCPRQLAAGVWRYHGMIGYTSTGAGTSIVDVRFNCPAEITLHCLRSGTSQ